MNCVDWKLVATSTLPGSTFVKDKDDGDDEFDCDMEEGSDKYFDRDLSHDDTSLEGDDLHGLALFGDDDGVDDDEELHGLAFARDVEDDDDDNGCDLEEGSDGELHGLEFSENGDDNDVDCDCDLEERQDKNETPLVEARESGVLRTKPTRRPRFPSNDALYRHLVQSKRRLTARKRKTTGIDEEDFERPTKRHRVEEPAIDLPDTPTFEAEPSASFAPLRPKETRQILISELSTITGIYQSSESRILQRPRQSNIAPRTLPPFHPNIPMRQQMEKARQSRLLSVARKRKATAMDEDLTRPTKRRRIQADVLLLPTEHITNDVHESFQDDINIDDEEDEWRGFAFAGDYEDDEDLHGLEFAKDIGDDDDGVGASDGDLREGSDLYFDDEEVSPTVEPIGVVVGGPVEDGDEDEDLHGLAFAGDDDDLHGLEFVKDDGGGGDDDDDDDGVGAADGDFGEGSDSCFGDEEVSPTVEPIGVVLGGPVEDGVSVELSDIVNDEIEFETIVEVEEEEPPTFESFVNDPVVNGPDEPVVEENEPVGGAVSVNVPSAGDWTIDASVGLVRRSTRRASRQMSDDVVDDSNSTPATTGLRRSARLALKKRPNYKD